MAGIFRCRALRPVASWGLSGENCKTEPECLSGNSEDAMLLGVDVEQHLVVDAQWLRQSLQRQPEQRQRQLEQRHEQ